MATTVRTDEAAAGRNRRMARVRSPKRLGRDRIVTVAMVAPSVIAIGVFVYGFIGWTGWVSVSNWTSFVRDLSFSGLDSYRWMLTDFRYLSGLRNVIVFTILFVGASLIIGLIVAIALDRSPRGHPVWRTIFLFPLAISFVVTGVVWQWLLHPSAGLNLPLAGMGLEDLPLWYVSTTVIPGVAWGRIEMLVPLALVAVVLAAGWQLSGFAMAIYLAGLQGVSEDLREAARVDGASEGQIYRHVILPLLKPMTITIIIVLGHMALKTFDLIYTMTGPGTGYVTDVPAVYMYEMTFRANQFARGAAISISLLVLMLLLMGPAIRARRKVEEETTA